MSISNEVSSDLAAALLAEKQKEDMHENTHENAQENMALAEILTRVHAALRELTIAERKSRRRLTRNAAQT